MSYEFTIIIPVFNEEDNLNRVEISLSKYLKIASKKTNVLFINDGSTDDSQQLIESICSNNSNFSYIKFERNYGLSAAIFAGFKHVTSEFVGYIDADLQTNPEDFNVLLDEIENFELITGVRSSRKDSFVKNMSSRIANGIRRAFTNDGMDDTGCPLKVLKTDFAKNIPMFNGLHRFLPAMILLQQGRIKQISVRHYPRIAGTSKFGVYNRLINPLIDCFAYVWMRKNYINYSIEKKS
ncbi:MAG: glycosyltransferase [Lutibacter sp.]|nr:glycosyltransferase [Lutibacter sp.]